MTPLSCVSRYPESAKSETAQRGGKFNRDEGACSRIDQFVRIARSGLQLFRSPIRGTLLPRSGKASQIDADDSGGRGPWGSRLLPWGSREGTAGRGQCPLLVAPRHLSMGGKAGASQGPKGQKRAGGIRSNRRRLHRRRGRHHQGAGALGPFEALVEPRLRRSPLHRASFLLRRPAPDPELIVVERPR